MATYKFYWFVSIINFICANQERRGAESGGSPIFDSNAETCYGLCRCQRVLFITTRGMNIATGDPREQGSSYIKAISRLWGLGPVFTIAADNMDYCTPKEAEAKIAECIQLGRKMAEG